MRVSLVSRLVLGGEFVSFAAAGALMFAGRSTAGSWVLFVASGFVPMTVWFLLVDWSDDRFYRGLRDRFDYVCRLAEEDARRWERRQPPRR